MSNNLEADLKRHGKKLTYYRKKKVGENNHGDPIYEEDPETIRGFLRFRSNPREIETAAGKVKQVAVEIMIDGNKEIDDQLDERLEYKGQQFRIVTTNPVGDGFQKLSCERVR
ncbi:hypothetical protein [Natroniella sp. ANB-PHB2]|uniref:hypothetical protein n=1 Tax=Natroniella sp. ANB-PHB2 TaxID=3384444 RepID=UPI0038D3DBD6